MTFYGGHNSEYGHWIRYSIGSFGASSSIGDIYLNDNLAQNQEFLYACTSEIKVNVSRFIEPIQSPISASTTLLTSVGPFILEIMPNGQPQPLFVSFIADAYDDLNAFITSSITAHLRQASSKAGTFFSFTEYGTHTMTGSSDTDRTFTITGSLISSGSSASVLTIEPNSVRSLRTDFALTSRSLDAPKEAVISLPVYLDFHGLTTGSSMGVTGTLAFKQIFAQTFIPRISGSW